MTSVRQILACTITILALAAGADAQSWTSLGPTDGDVPRVVLAPSNPAAVLAIPGNDNGGLFLTTNSGASWQSISAGLCNVHVTNMAFHPTTPTTIYATTNVGGVCRSTDSGATWTGSTSGLPMGTDNFPRRVNGIAINWTTPATVVVGTDSGIYRSTDSGATWTLAAATGVEIQDVAISKSTPATAYAAAKNGVFKSTDAGATWVAVNTGLPSSVEDGLITVDPTNADVAYYAATEEDTPNATGVYKTINGGTSWAAASTGLGTPFFLINVVVDPSNPNTLYVNAIGGCGLCKSTNGGGSWAPAGATGLPAVPAFGITNVAQTLAIDPGTPTRLYAGSIDGVYVSTDSAVTWTGINSGLAARKVSTPVLLGTTSKSLLVSARAIESGTHLLRLTAGVLPFSSVTSPLATSDSGKISAMVTDPTNNSIIYIVGGKVNDNDCGQVYKTTDGGTSWTNLLTNAATSGITTGTCGGSLAIDATTPTTLYLGITFGSGGGAIPISVYKSINGGVNWTASGSGLPGVGVTHIAVAAVDPNILYLGSGGAVYRSANSGATWSNVSTGLPVTSGGGGGGAFFGGVSRVAIDPTDANIVYAATHAGVYRTTNGTNWTARTAGWPTLNGVLYSAGIVAIDPATPATIYATPATPTPGPSGFLGIGALGAGLLKSTDSGLTWGSAGAPLAGVIVNDLAFDGSRIFATTSNGVFRFSPTSPATITLDRTALTFAATTSGTALTSQTAAQTVRLTQGAGSAVTWTATSDKPWLTVTPASGSGSAPLTIAVRYDGTLPASGSVTGAITLALTGAANNAGPINVTFTIVSTAAAVSPAFGVFDTPAGDATVLAGSIAVTGWALDNVGVERVEIWRDLQAGETTPPFASTPSDPRNGKVFISNAVFVVGARPDVEAFYPTTPFSYRAGWGYLLLTWGLNNQGNGTYTLRAYAFDQESNVTTLGSKTIVVSNNTATAPFGSIDTPGIGGDASGPNFGWALTPRVNGAATCKIQPSGVQVSIDSGPLQPVIYEGNRTDIAGGFPGFSNTNGAGGHYVFDWSTLANGVHTIGWLITDDCNRADGVGSRFFNVTTGTNLLAGQTNAVSAIAAPILSASALRPNEPESDDPITVARGFGELPEIVTPGQAGSRIVEVKQGERIEIRVPRGFETAYQLVNGGVRRVLPIGAGWDAASGTFAWQPAAGFLGRFRLVFTNGSERISVRVVVTP